MIIAIILSEPISDFVTVQGVPEKCEQVSKRIDPFPKRHRLVHNGGFLKFQALYCSQNMTNSTEIS